MSQIIQFKAIAANGDSEKEKNLAGGTGSLQIVSTGVTTGAAFQLQGSNDGINWSTVVTNPTTITVAANGTLSATFVDQAFRFYRLHPTAYTDGTHTAWLFIAGSDSGYIRGEA